MANTYTQIYIQFVFAVQNRVSLIKPEWEPDLYQYITGMIQNKSHKMIAINGMPDHIHIFIGYKPTDPIPELIKVVKSESTKWINQNRLVRYRFQWQKGYGAFSYSRSHIDSVYRYIQNQKIHHKKKSFRDEYIDLLNKFEISFKEGYIFNSIED